MNERCKFFNSKSKTTNLLQPYQHSSLLPSWVDSAHVDFRQQYGDKSRNKVLNLGNSRQYVGDIVNGKPDGHGILILADGSQHIGTFRAGRANGLGYFLNQRGSVLKGNWVENRRSGYFQILDYNGNTYVEKYEHGERIDRTKTDNVSGQYQSNLCIRCQCRFFAEFNHPYSCRRPKRVGENPGEVYGINQNSGEVSNKTEPEWEYSTHVSFI